MSKDQRLNRRELIAGTAAIAGSLATTPACSEVKADTATLSGKSILITGCSSGFGRLGAEHYAKLGAKVIATMRNLPRPEADELRALAKRDGLDIHVLEIDVRSEDQVNAGVKEAEKLAGGVIDVLINNAGLGISGPVEVQDMEATELTFDTNVFGCLRMAQAALPAMRQAKSGQIFNISSQLGRMIVPSIGHYCASKFALEAMSEQMAYELVPHGVEVTIIEPGGYPTKVWTNRNQYAADLRQRTGTELQAAYPELVEAMGHEDGSGRTTDPMDVPRAIAAVIALPAGKRPLRKIVHPSFRPQEAINKVSADSQLEFLGQSAFGPWVKDVLD
ncbi:MAG: SDR family oxidoreductase [Parasphingorhabdus sp.]